LDDHNDRNDHSINDRLKIAVLETELRSMKDALRLQAIEYERRLQDLNHAHQQQVDRNAQYISREIWEAYLKEDNTWKRSIDQWRWTSVGIGAGLGAAGGAALSSILKLF